MMAMPEGARELLHFVGYAVGAALYAMLLAMVLRDRAGDRLMVGTGVLGLIWNGGELGAYALRAAGGSPAAASWFSASAFGALGFLAALIVHAVCRTPAGRASSRAGVTLLTGLAYACAAAAAAINLAAAASGRAVPVPVALYLLTGGLAALAPALVLATRPQAAGSRAIWMAGLAVFAVSALHLGNFHGEHESWVAELVGHHASIPLAFAILYQDYRFALADLFLKQALALLALVALVFGAWSLAAPWVADAATDPSAAAWLLGIWIVTALAFAPVRRAVDTFVDRVVLMRPDYDKLLRRIEGLAERSGDEHHLLTRSTELLAPALNATTVSWVEAETGEPGETWDVAITTAEAPSYRLRIGRLAGGRRLLSDDVAMLHRAAALVGRRIDALRFTAERYARLMHEREMRSLATEAELSALRAQINPHFLFNTLTTIGFLIQSAPARALETLMRLTSLLRSGLRPDAAFTTLGRERDLVESYLQIEHARLEERLQFRLEIPESLAGCVIPALIVQPLVENAVRHGIAPSRTGGCVQVNAFVVEGKTGPTLRIAVSNTGAPLSIEHAPTAGFGVGLENVARRLSGHYGDRARLELRAADDGSTRAEIEVPFEAAGEEPVRRAASA